jgi:hypothetical protein
MLTSTACCLPRIGVLGLGGCRWYLMADAITIHGFVVGNIAPQHRTMFILMLPAASPEVLFCFDVGLRSMAGMRGSLAAVADLLGAGVRCAEGDGLVEACIGRIIVHAHPHEQLFAPFGVDVRLCDLEAVGRASTAVIVVVVGDAGRGSRDGVVVQCDQSIAPQTAAVGA